MNSVLCIKESVMAYGLAFTLVVLAFINVSAQQPFEEYGYKVKSATLSNGKYVETFDQDTLVEIGSVIINLKRGKVEYFIIYDTIRSEADLQSDLISRWMSPDPLSGERHNFSPYNFVRNNPIIFTDPTGALDEYYGIVNNELVYLGSDGQGNNIRLVAEDRHTEAAPLLQGSNTSQDQISSLRQSDMSTVVTFDEGTIQKEAQGASDRSNLRGKENSFVITLDPSSATVSAQSGPEGNNGNIDFGFKSSKGSEGRWTSDGSKLVVGTGHGHPETTIAGRQSEPGYSRQDAETAASNGGYPYYAMDSNAVDVGSPAPIHESVPGSKKGVNQVGTTQQTNELGKKSFKKTARPYQQE